MSDRSFKVSDTQNYEDELRKFLQQSPMESTMKKICENIVKQKNNAMAIEFTKVICELLMKNGVYIHCTETRFSENITENSIEEKYGICFDGVDFSEHDQKFTDEIKELKSRLDRKQTEIDQIDKILNELLDVTFEICETEEGFAGFKNYLEKKIKMASVTNFLSSEPIKVANALISADEITSCENSTYFHKKV